MNGTTLQTVFRIDGTDCIVGARPTVRHTRWQRAMTLSSLLLLLLLLLLLAFTSGCDDDEPNVEPQGEKRSPVELAPYDARGPFVVGFRELEAPAIGGEPAFKVKVPRTRRSSRPSRAAGGLEEVCIGALHQVPHAQDVGALQGARGARQ